MALYSTEAIIIGAKNWGETDRIITLLSPEKGLIKATAFGARRPKSQLAGALQLFNIVEIQLAAGERLDTVRQCSLKKAYPALMSDFTAMAYGSFVAELAALLAIEDFPQADMYKELTGIFAAFGQRNPRIVALAAAFKLLEGSGMQLAYTSCIRCGEEIEGDAMFSIGHGGAICSKCQADAAVPYPAELRQFIAQLISLDWNAQPSFRVSKTALLAAEDLMLRYLRQIFDKPLKSLEFISQL